MEPEITAAVAGGITLIAGVIAAGTRLIFNRINNILKEVRPNGGSSMRDQINRLEGRVDDLFQLMSERK